MHDEFQDGRKMRVPTVIDVFTRKCLALEARRRFGRMDVAAVLSGLVADHGKPQSIQCDQERSLPHWRWITGRTGTK